MTPPTLKQLIPHAPDALCNILDRKRGLLDAPIRSEILGPMRFAQHGRSLGQTHQAVLMGSRAGKFFPRLLDNIQTLRDAQRYIGDQAASGDEVSPAAEWLLDNFHLIEAQLHEIHEGLPRSYFRSLPVLREPPLAGLPRVYGVAWAFVAHTDGAFDEGLLTHFLLAYQEVTELNLSEMWALPTTLRVVLVENLRRLAERLATNKAAREAANLCCDHIDTCTPHVLDGILGWLKLRGASSAFLTQMALRLQDRRSGWESSAHIRCHAWLHKTLPDAAAALAQANADQAADNLSVSNAVTSLRSITDAEWPDIVAKTSAMMQWMLQSPVFKAEHPQTRDQTLHAIEHLARRSGRSELNVTRTLLAMMHPAEDTSPAWGTGESTASHWLHGEGRASLHQALGIRVHGAVWRRALGRHLALPLYLGLLMAGTIGLVACLWRWYPQGPRPDSAWPWLGLVGLLLTSIPASEAVIAITNRLISESTRPRHLPRLGLATGIPAAHRVMVVIPALLTDANGVKALVHQLHLHYLANPEEQAQFALLTDWADADTVHCASDQGLLDLAIEGIRALNVQHARAPDALSQTGGAPRFILLHRHRLFSPSEQRWIGWERKRGKLALLISALAEGHSHSFMDLGPESRMAEQVRHIVTLDSDTQMPPGQLRALVGVAAHPHNQPRLDATGRQVVRGYAILQPRTVPPLPARSEVTLYHWLFAGQCGIDTYSHTSSEVYQDLFGEGSFNGKGLLNVQALHAVLSERLPEGLVLSHDLLEGAMARCAAVTDISLIEDAPHHADVAAARQHRWTRGDWQLLPFLMRPWRFQLRPVHVWKMCDNLRRSLLAPASLLLLVLSLGGVGISPWAALALVAAAFSGGPLLGALASLAPSRPDVAVCHFLHRAWTDTVRVLLGGAWLLVQLPQHALLAADAITRALFRMTVSHRHLLQWTTAAALTQRAKDTRRDLLRLHWKEPVVAMGLFTGIALAEPNHRLLTGLLCLAWASAPLWTWWVSRPRPRRHDQRLTDGEGDYLRGVARDTWRYFERCVGEADQHLPPDNLQTSPVDEVAHRTSPTNIGLYLLSVACARQFGWIGTQELLSRLEATLGTLHQLERHHGHFLNWYDTQTLAPLQPMYLSTVDSGNLCGHLLATAQACRALANAPYDATASGQALQSSWARLAHLLPLRATLPGDQRDRLRWLLADHRTMTRSALRDQLAHAQELAATDATGAPGEAAERLLTLARALEQLVDDADFTVLYHPRRHLFHLGLRVGEQQLDTGFYDLLASEACLTGLLAVAKGDVPMNHWIALGRPCYARGADIGLRSWSGSMFEYLMPSLVLDEPDGSVLRSACHTAVMEQMAYTWRQGIPWGISESAHAGRDSSLAYQYAPHGVPRLALRRTPPDELVIAPYATALAAQIAPKSAAHNFQALEKVGGRGRYGFVEALDYSVAQRLPGQAFAQVSTFMAHHQGMSIVALANVLLDGVAQRWGMANVRLQAVSSLLHERTPREVSNLYAPLSAPALHTGPTCTPGMLRHATPGDLGVPPTHLLSNGRYHVSLRPNGAGTSRLGEIDITRSRDDALRDAQGHFLYLRGAGKATPVSLTQHPAPDPEVTYQCTFHADRVCLAATWPHWQTHVTVWVSPEDHIEFRQVELMNLSDSPLDIELLSAFELALSPSRADEAHPAFANLFVQAQWHAEQEALSWRRAPRLPSELPVLAAHFVAESDRQTLAVTAQTSRQAWAGRNRHASQPASHFAANPTTDTGLDPVSALSVTLRVAPQGKAVVTFATAVADTPAMLHALIDKYRQHTHVQRASMMSATLASIRLRALQVNAESFAALQNLSTALLMHLTRDLQPSPTPPHTLPAAQDRRALWRLGIAGDRPIILVSVEVMQGLRLLRTIAQGLRLWAWSGVVCDLVVINSEAHSYHMPLQRELMAQRDRYLAEAGAEAPASNPHRSGYHLLQADTLSCLERHTLESVARLHFVADGRPLQHHVFEWMTAHDRAALARAEHAALTVPLGSTSPQHTSAPTGRFDDATGAFEFDVTRHLRPQRPWINVIANAGFGTHVSESGGGCTWARNSRNMQITPWANDPVADPPAEHFLLQDCTTLDTWSVCPSAWGQEAARYHVIHGQGYSRIHHRHAGLDITATWCVDEQAAVKQVQIAIHNLGLTPRTLRVIGMVEWLMGAHRADRSSVHTGVNRPRNSHPRVMALTCTQQERQSGFGDATAFLAMCTPDEEPEDWTCDRRECFDAKGQLVLPDRFGRRSGSGLDPCAALSGRLTLRPGATAERVFLLGFADSHAAACELAQHAQQAGVASGVSAQDRLSRAQAAWDTLLGATTVKTPDPLFDVMVNRWLLYQTVGCRLWAKSGLYQAGGATGFRDQLQDAMALSWAAPERLREQIRLCASRQFVEGDVQHWWHAPRGDGVRTHFSDDLLWLPHACAHHLRTTGDASLLDEAVPFLEGVAIPPGADDVYDVPSVSAVQATVYEHAARTIDRSLRTGLHGLPLMGTGDWNDGMNRVGHEGRGESVWLGWLLCDIVADFAPLALARGEHDRVQRWTDSALGWRSALNGEAWDGRWFKRAYFDHGQALGSHLNAQGRIDLIAQAWSVLSGAAEPELQRMAMASVEACLVDPEAGLIRLLAPPLVNATPSAGYIQAYPPGVRENGSQYSHAGVWALMALTALARQQPQSEGRQKMADTAFRWFTWLSPAHRTAHAAHGAVYGLEPYAMAGDVYSQPPRVGQGGWSWYTGSAAWMHRTAIESIFGLRIRGNLLSFDPCLPSHWPQAELTLRRDGRSVRFILRHVASSETRPEQMLLPGHTLDWSQTADGTVWVVPLQNAVVLSEVSVAR